MYCEKIGCLVQGCFSIGGGVYDNSQDVNEDRVEKFQGSAKIQSVDHPETTNQEYKTWQIEQRQNGVGCEGSGDIAIE